MKELKCAKVGSFRTHIFFQNVWSLERIILSCSKFQANIDDLLYKLYIEKNLVEQQNLNYVNYVNPQFVNKRPNKFILKKAEIAHY